MMAALAERQGIAVWRASAKQVERQRVRVEPGTVAVGSVPFVKHALRQLGTALPVHNPYPDFGTGYSSLAYLQRFRAKQLKIDRFFTNGLDAHGHEGSAIVAAIIALAHSLEMERGIVKAPRGSKIKLKTSL
jgi:sensor c-di-GMP phosphodiesterase-like protein